MYAVLTALVLVGYALVVAGMGLIFTTAVRPNNLWVGLFLFILALVLEPLRTRIQEFMDFDLLPWAARLCRAPALLQP